MPREAKGSTYQSYGTWYASITVSTGKRRSFALPGCASDGEAAARSNLLAQIAVRMRKGRRPDLTPHVLEQAAAAAGDRLAAVLEVVDDLCSTAFTDAVTFEDVARKWTRGDLHREYPLHVKDVDHHTSSNIQRLEKWVYPIVGSIPVDKFDLADAERVIRQPKLPDGSKRHVAQLIVRVMNLSVYPLKAIKASPIPKGWLPKKSDRKAASYLYPTEDRALLANRAVPLVARLLCGVLAREGMRTSEAANLTWSDLELDVGAIHLDENKTDDPRTWSLDEGVVRALRWWKTNQSPKSVYVFPGKGDRHFNAEHLAEQLRGWLADSSVERTALFTKSDRRMRLRAHDLRATFVTLSLANGRTEAWVCDRTGHQSGDMLARYRRAARTAAELKLGELSPLDKSIPEIETSGSVGGSKGGEGGGGEVAENKMCDGRGSNPQALRRRNLNPAEAIDTVSEKRERRADSDAGSARSAPPPDGSDVSPTIRQRLRKTRVGRAVDDAIAAAMTGDLRLIAKTMLALGELHGRKAS